MIKCFSGSMIFSFLLILLTSCNSTDSRKVLIETEYGNMTFELYDDTPLHKENFIKLVEEGFYNDLEFHRVIDGFMIQGGDPVSKHAGPDVMLGNGGPGYTIPAEIGRPHYKGTLAAARMGDHMNPDKESSGSQFYIVQGTVQEPDLMQTQATMRGIQYSEKQKAKYFKVGGTPQLDREYTVFGEIVEGMEVIDKIASVPKGANDRPVTPVKMKVKMVN